MTLKRLEKLEESRPEQKKKQALREKEEKET